LAPLGLSVAELVDLLKHGLCCGREFRCRAAGVTEATGLVLLVHGLVAGVAEHDGDAKAVHQ
jgi:hypothetical protein